MKPFDQKEVSRRFKLLPEAAQDIALSEATEAALGQTFAFAGISGEVAKQCSQQITLVGVGLASAEDFEAYLKNDLHLDEIRTGQCMSTVRAGILGPMRRALLAAIDQKNAESATTLKPTRDPAKGTALQAPGTTPSHDPYQERV